uniref:Uncharacterized protein n=1 Tax=Muthill virus TaxID=1807803 RepID=A0A1L3KJV2_9VIRU|nr:hypothetical protein [Muthill virus]
MTSDASTFKPSFFRPDLNDVLTALESSNSDKLLSSFLQSKGENAIKNLIASHYVAYFDDRKKDKVFNRSVTIHTHLKPNQQALLTEAYPGLALTFTQRTRHSHSFANASRTCEFYNLLYERIHYDPIVDNKLLTDNHWDVFVKDVGGDPSNILSHSIASYHSCSPVISTNAYDSSRYTNRLVSTLFRRTKLVEERNEILTNLTTGVTNSKTCRRLAQDCNVRSPFLMFLHSIYDMTQVDIANAFDSANAIIGFASFIYTDEIMVQPFGELSELGVWWRYTDYPKNVQWSPTHVMNFIQGDIVFGFSGDDGYNYRHNLARYKSHVTCMRFCSSRGVVINSELLENRCGIQFIKYSRELIRADKGVSHTLNIKSMENKYIVTFYDTCSLFQSSSVIPTKAYSTDPEPWLQSKRVIPVRFLVDKSPVDNTRSYLSTVKDNLKPNDVLNYMRNYLSRSVVNGSVVDIRLTIPPHELGILARALYLQTYDSNYCGGKIVQQALHDIDIARRRYYFPWMPSLVNSDFLNLDGRTINTRSKTLDMLIDSTSLTLAGCVYYAVKTIRHHYFLPPGFLYREFSTYIPYLKHVLTGSKHSVLHTTIGGCVGLSISRPIILSTAVTVAASASCYYAYRSVLSNYTPVIVGSFSYFVYRGVSYLNSLIFPKFSHGLDFARKIMQWKKTKFHFSPLPSFINLIYLSVPVAYFCTKYALRYMCTPPTIRPIDPRNFIVSPVTKFSFVPKPIRVRNINVDYYVPTEMTDDQAEQQANEFIKHAYGIDITSPDEHIIPLINDVFGKPSKDIPEPHISTPTTALNLDDEKPAVVESANTIPELPTQTSNVEVATGTPRIEISDKTTLHRITIPGDGVCCFRSAVVARDVDIATLRSDLLKSAPKENHNLIEELTAPNWGGSAALEYMADHFGVQYAVHEGSITHNFGNSSRVVHLEYKQSHYNLLIPDHKFTDVVTVSIKSFPPFKLDETLKKLSRFINVSPTERHGYHYSHNLDHYCHHHSACLNNSFERVLRDNSAHNNMVFFLEKTPGMFNLDLLNQSLISHGLHAYVHCVPLTDHYVLSVHTGYRALLTLSDFAAVDKHNHDCSCDGPSKPKTVCRNVVCYCGDTLMEYEHVSEPYAADLIIQLINSNSLTRTSIIDVTHRASSECLSLSVNVDEACRLVDHHEALERFNEHLTRNSYSTVNTVLIETCVVDPQPILSLISKKFPHIGVKHILNKSGGDIRDLYTPVVERNDDDRVRNCMEERRELWKHDVHFTINSLKAHHDRLVNAHTNNMPLICPDAYYHLYDVYSNRVLCGTGVVTSDVRWGWDGEKLINFDRLSSSNLVKVTDSHYISFNRHSILVQAFHHYNLVKAIDLSQFKLKCQLRVIQGVPGAGKTEYILSNVDHTKKSLLLTLTRTAKDDMLRRAEKRTRLSNSPNNMDIMTFDSFMINFNTRDNNYEEVWFDEARLTHGGDWLWTAYLTSCRKLTIVGDVAQIPYIDRTHFIPKYTVPAIFHQDSIALSKSHRCPADIVRWMNVTRRPCGSPIYPFTVTTTSKIIHSVETKSIAGVEQVIRSDDAQYLVFTQNELQEMINAGFTNTRTVHQYQGNQNANIILVRLDVKDAKPLFRDVSYMIVAFSRHTHSLTYLSVSSNNDPILAQLTNIKNYSEYDIKGIGGGELYDTYHKKIVVQQPSTKAVYLYPALVRFLNDRYGFGSYIPLSIKSFIKAPYRESSPVLEPDDIVDHASLLQEFADRLYFTEADVSMDHVLYHQSDKSFIGEMSFIPLHQILHTRRTAIPQLRTPLRKKVPATQTQLIKAFCERNGAVPLLEGEVDQLQMAQLLFNTVMSVCDPNVVDIATSSNITSNANSLMLWLSKQPEVVRNQISADPQDLLDKDLSEYSFTLKGNAKPDLDRAPETRYKSAQTIAFQDKLINSFFCPAMADFTDRIIASLNENIILFNRMSVDEYCSNVDRICPWERFQFLSKFYEIDFSKFDKSQDLIALHFEMLLMERFGMPRDLLNLWLIMHKETTLRDIRNRFRSKVLYQRKSGDAGTWVLNTLFQMAVVIHTLGIAPKIINGTSFCTFSGDDSLVFVDNNHFSDSHISHSCAILFNLEVKLLRHTTPYFCSKFFIPTAKGVLFVPDVVKTIIKLGRKDLVNSDHAAEYYISFCDNNKPLLDAFNWHLIDHCINDRYNLTGEHVITYRAICTIMRHKSKFMELWDYSGTSSVSVLPSLDI